MIDLRKPISGKSMKLYTCKISSNQYPNGQYVTIESNEGLKGVSNHIQTKGWKQLSGIYQV